MSNHTREHARYREQYPERGLTETVKGRGHDRTQALRSLLGGNAAVYAIRTRDGLVKIGYTTRLWRRVNEVGGEIIGFKPGTPADEKAIHQGLIEYRARGQEYYHPTPAVLAVVNAMRDEWNLPHVAA